MPLSREDFLNKYIRFTLFTPKLDPLFSLTYRCYIPSTGRQPIAIGHLSDSGDLKNNIENDIIHKDF